MHQVLYIDPINATTQYNYCLMGIFKRANLPVWFLTSKFVWDKDFPDTPQSQVFFFKTSTQIYSMFNSSQKLRQILRAIEYPFDLLRLKKYIIAERPRIVHFNWSRLPRIDYRFIRYLKSAKIRVVYTAHNFIPHDNNYDKLFFRIYHNIYKAVDTIVTLTEFVKNQIVKEMGIPKEKVYVVPHTNYKPIIQEIEGTSYTHIKKPSSSRIILFFGLIHPYKGLDMLLNAFQTLQYSYPNYKLKICGNSYEDFSRYRTLIDRLGLDINRIQIDLRFLSMKESINVLKNADIVVLPYKTSSQSGIIPLANSLGTPVIATRVGGIPEMIEEGVNGYIVPPEDAKLLGTKISEILENPQEMMQLRKGAFWAAEFLFSDQIILEKFRKIYDM